MGWVRVRKLKLNSGQMEALLVGSNLVLGNSVMLMSMDVSLTPKSLSHILSILLGPGFLFED